jgi:hypothetical protein
MISCFGIVKQYCSRRHGRAESVNSYKVDKALIEPVGEGRLMKTKEKIGLGKSVVVLVQERK